MNMTRNEYRKLIFGSALSAHAKLACLALMEYAGADKNTCWPSQDTIAEDCSVSRNTIRAALKQAEEAGFVTSKRVRRHGRRYTILEYALSYQCAAPAQGNAQGNAQGFERAIERANERSPAAQEPIEPIEPINPPIIPPLGGADYAPEFEEFWKAWMPFDMTRGTKSKAAESYTKALRLVTHERLMKAADRYCRACERKRSKTQHVATWLNQRGWEAAEDETVVPLKRKLRVGTVMGYSLDD